MTLDDAVRYAPIVTATVAVLALTIAMISIAAQKTVARRRAAIDFFLRTEMDEKVIVAFGEFQKAVEVLKKSESMQTFSETVEHTKIRVYLNIHELMAVGIHNNIFDQRICYDFWSDVLDQGYTDTKPLIDFVRAQPGEAETYTDLIQLHNRWNGPHWIWQWWRSRWWPLQF